MGFVISPDRPVEMVSLGAIQPINEAIRAWGVTYGMSARGRGSQVASRAGIGIGRKEIRGEDRARFTQRGCRRLP